MTLTNPYDKKPKAVKKTEPEESRATHHAPIHRSKAYELCHYSQEAYKPEGGQPVEAIFIEHSLFGVNDIQCVIYKKDDRRIVSFRGSQELTDWLTDFTTISIRLSQVFPFIKETDDLYAHRGFTKSLKPIYDKIKFHIANYTYDLTGHSLGAALATIFGYVYALDTGVQPDNFYTFGSPRVFLNNPDFPVSRFDELMEMVRIQNDNDVVSYYPQKGGFEALAKHGGAGAIMGAVAGSAVGGGLLAGALYGSVMGGTLAMGSGGYVHVGSGVILFEDLNSIVYAQAGGQRVLKGRNYYLMPEGVDLMRDPLDIQSTLTQKIGTMGVIETSFEAVRRLYGAYTGFGSFLDEGRRDGVIARAKNIFNTAVRGRMSNEIVRRVAQSRTRDAVMTRSLLVYHADRMQSLTGRIWAQPSTYLTGELLRRYNIMSGDMETAALTWMGRIPYKEAGFNSPPTSADLDALSGVFTREVLNLINTQLSGDTRVARQFYSMLGLSMTVEMALVAYAGHDVYHKMVGHKLTNYHRRLLDLPDTIYEGFSKQDKLYSPDRTFNQVRDNVYVSNGQYYYLSHTRDGTTMRPMVQKILGYILYSPEEEKDHLNKIVCF